MNKRLNFGFALCALVLTLIISCRRSVADIQYRDVQKAMTWFQTTQKESEYHPVFQHSKLLWHLAKERTYPNGNKVIVVPMIEETPTVGYMGKRLLYLFPFKHGEGYITRVLEYMPSVKYIIQHKGVFHNKDFSGIITAWDLRKGFQTGVKVENAVPVANVILTPIVDKQSINRNVLSSTSTAGRHTFDWLTPVTVSAIYQSGNNTYFTYSALMDIISQLNQILGGGGTTFCEYTNCSADNMDNLFQDQTFATLAYETQTDKDKNWLKDKVKDSTNMPCIAAILAALANLNNTVPSALRCNSGGEPNFQTTLKAANLGAGAGGETNPLLNTDNNYPITINTYYADASNLSRLATMLHEFAHAQLLGLYENAAKLGDTASQRFVVENYGYLLSPDVTNTFNFQYLMNTGQSHSIMSDQYIGPLGAVLYDYAVSQGISGVTPQYCQDLMWSGLQSTSAFTSQSQTIKDRIQDAIDAERLGTDSNGNNAKGSSCN